MITITASSVSQRDSNSAGQSDLRWRSSSGSDLARAALRQLGAATYLLPPSARALSFTQSLPRSTLPFTQALPAATLRLDLAADALEAADDRAGELQARS